MANEVLNPQHDKDKLVNPVQDKTYDHPGNAPSKNPGQHAPRPEADKKTLSPEELAEKEQSGGTNTQSASEDESRVGQGYTGNGSQKKKQGRTRFNLTKRKRLFGGGIIAGIIGLVVFLFTLASGPLQLIHLAQILQKNFFGSENTSHIRSKSLFRYARSGGDASVIEKSRLNKLGKITYSRTLSQLKDIGIEFERNSLGSPKSMTIDVDKNPDYKGLSRAAVKEAIIRDFKITNSNIVSGVVGGKVTVNIDNTSVKGLDFSKSLARTALGKLDKGKLATAMGFRYLKTAWKLPRLFSPLQKRITAGQNRVISVIEARQTEKARIKATVPPETVEVARAKAKVQNTLKNNAGKIGAALLGTTLLCVVRGVADDVVTVNRAMIVLPVTAQAIDKIAIGSQVQSGQNFDINQLGAVADSFEDENGKSIWEGKALQATEGLANPGGEDLSADFVQAFSNKTTAASIKSAISVKLGGVDFTGLACSKIGLSVQLAVGVAVAVATIPTGGGSVGAWIAAQSAIAAGSAGAIYLLHQQLQNLLSNKAVVPEVFSGPLGGNLLAYGARETSNIGARASGGVELSGTETAALDRQQQIASRIEFQNKSVAGRLFDVYDNRSLISRVINNTGASPSQNLAKVANLFTHFGSFFANAFSSLTPHAVAAAEPYNWGFPRYGIPTNLAEDIRYEDPYANADVVAQQLNRDNCDTKSSCGLRKRAMACFGVDISKGVDGWQVVAKTDVNPNDEAYLGAKCDDSSENWHRIMLFVFDSRLMDATACYEGVDEQSCTNVGMDSTDTTGSTTTGSAGTTTTSTPTGDAQQLARQILDNKNTDLNASNYCRYCSEDIQNTADGKPAYGNVRLDINLLKFLAELGQSTKVDVNSITGAGTGHSKNSNHYAGTAIDFECNGISGTLLDAVALKYGLSSNDERCDAGIDHWHYSTSGS